MGSTSVSTTARAYRSGRASLKACCRSAVGTAEPCLEDLARDSPGRKPGNPAPDVESRRTVVAEGLVDLRLVDLDG